jgi:5-amino-6-(5-phosphoribosylamino)uracil reductase
LSAVACSAHGANLTARFGGVFRVVHPEPGTITPEEIGAAIRSLTPGDRDRPYLLANFVASADGRATFSGRSGKLGDDGDRAMFRTLRASVDAVIVGTGTLGTERYGRLIPDPDVRAQRAQRGLEPEPLACVVTRSGRVPEEIPLFAEPDARIVVFTAAPLELRCAARVLVVELDPAELTLTTVLRRLHDHGIRLALCEGGPRLFGGLVREHIVDELFLTLAPKLTGGGTGPAISSGPELGEPLQLRLLWALERANSLYLRYAVG